MERLIFQDLRRWKQAPHRKPLILRGARQVGKTHTVRQLGKTFDHFVEINFEKTPELTKVFEQDLNPVRIIKELSLVLGVTIIAEKTLLFFDEVQQSPKSILSLRYFYEEMPNLHVIAAGSLVDFAIDQVGVPVGRVSFLYLYPLSFIEYLYACGQKNLAIEIVKHAPTTEISEIIHLKILHLLAEYISIGGMPKVIDQWINTGDIQLCTSILQDIKNAYEQDFTKYAKKNEIKYVELLFKHIPGLICQPFKYSSLSTDYRKRELEPSLHLLEKAGILHLVMHSAGNGMPLGAEANFSRFKLIMLDVGLCQTMLGFENKEWLINPLFAFVNKSKLVENFVGQELLVYTNPSNKQNLYYWRRELRGSNAEVDYLIAANQHIIPLEVKSGHGGRLQSMKLFLQAHPSSPYGIRFSTHNYSIHDHIHSYPLYAISSAIEDKKRILDFLET